MRSSYMSVTLTQAVAAIRTYNSGIYGRNKRLNIELDAEGYSIFEGGLGSTVETITEQVRWIGQDYGGTGNVLAGRKLPELIAESIFSCRDEYIELLSSIPSLVEDFHFSMQTNRLYPPFQRKFISPNSGKVSKNWMTWATKFWHFLKPHSFPIMDSRSKRFFEISSNKLPCDQYTMLLEQVHKILFLKEGWLPKLRESDSGYAPSDIKLWDKIAYELGAKN